MIKTTIKMTDDDVRCINNLTEKEFINLYMDNIYSILFYNINCFELVYENYELNFNDINKFKYKYIVYNYIK